MSASLVLLPPALAATLDLSRHKLGLLTSANAATACFGAAGCVNAIDPHEAADMACMDMNMLFDHTNVTCCLAYVRIHAIMPVRAVRAAGRSSQLEVCHGMPRRVCMSRVAYTAISCVLHAHGRYMLLYLAAL